MNATVDALSKMHTVVKGLLVTKKASLSKVKQVLKEAAGCIKVARGIYVHMCLLWGVFCVTCNL